MGTLIVVKDGSTYKIKECVMTTADGSVVVVVEENALGGVAH